MGIGPIFNPGATPSGIRTETRQTQAHGHNWKLVKGKNLPLFSLLNLVVNTSKIIRETATITLLTDELSPAFCCPGSREKGLTETRAVRPQALYEYFLPNRDTETQETQDSVSAHEEGARGEKQRVLLQRKPHQKVTLLFLHVPNSFSSRLPPALEAASGPKTVALR